MAIERRISRTGKTSYRVRLRMRGYPEISGTFDRASDAREFDAHTRLQHRAGQGGVHGEAKRHRLADAIDRYLALLPSLNLKDERNRRRQAQWWRVRLGDVVLADLSPTRLSAVRDELLVGERGPATVVRYLAALSAILSLAADDWGWLPDNPMKRVRKPKQPEGRVRYLSAEELSALLNEARHSASRCLHDVVVLALATGMRKGEMLSLRWRQVDLDRHLITLTETKNGKPRQLPLVGAALEAILERARAAHGPDDFVFPGARDGANIDITKAWNTVVRKAGLANFRFHDLRHTAASYLAMRGASTLEIGAVLGHRSPQMTQRYAHLSTDHTRKILAGMVDDVMTTRPHEAAGLG